MYTRNIDTGKWFNQTDSLNKDVYDNLRQDLEKVRLYSKCLSGATYLPIKSFTNIYDTIDNPKIGFYINENYSIPDYPIFGEALPLNSSNSNEFYTKYLPENAFTLKNLFTPNKLLKDQLKNYSYVDIATNGPIDVNATNLNLVIDGVRVIEGHRILVKDQFSEINLSINVNVEDYFTNVEPAASYIENFDNTTSKTYLWSNSENGIYKYTDGRLVRTTDLDNYDGSYRYSVAVYLGAVNAERQFHLKRLKNGYYPLTSEGANIEFEENKNWILRNRVDYNNIFDINYYDIIHHGEQFVYDEILGKTYSIKERTVAVGEFGVIINNQDKLNSSATFSISNIVSNKFKVNLRSICEVSKFYWICGDEGTILQMSKTDMSIRRVEVDETANFMSISFFDDLNGIVVGKFNTIYWTRNGGYEWNRIFIPEFDGYSYNSVLYYSLNQAYIGGEAGVFIELTYTTGVWQSYKRKVSKIIDEQDEFILVDDVNDISKTNWVSLVGTYSPNENSLSFAESLVFEWKLTPSYELKLEISSKYESNTVFQNSQYYICFGLDDVNGNTIYTGAGFLDRAFNPPISNYDIYQSGPQIKSDFRFSLLPNAFDPTTGNLKIGTYSLRISVLYNYNESNNTINSNFTYRRFTFDFSTEEAKVLLIAANNNNIICYDLENKIIKNSNFIYYSSTQSFSDVKTIARNPTNTEVYVGGDKVYKFNFSNFLDFSSISNSSIGTSSVVSDYYINKLELTEDNIYLAGNNSLLRFDDYNNLDFNVLDPTFDSKLKSRLLFLDYDIASKLNFFDDNGEYRLPNSVTFATGSFNATFSIDSLANEYNWLDYYKDAEKVFTYYSGMSESNRVEFSTTFSYTTILNSFTFSGVNINNTLGTILPYAPNINDDEASRYISGNTQILTVGLPTGLTALIYKYLIIFQTGIAVNIGDVLRLTSGVIDVNLVVNRVYQNVSLTGVRQTANIVYCYTNFNNNIITNLKNLTTEIKVENLNKYRSLSNLIQNFELHPVSIGYKLSLTDVVKLEARFNNKTAYYNLQSQVLLGTQSKTMDYSDSFLDFGYSPTYNIQDYLEKLDSNYFNQNSVFSILPKYYGLPGNNGGSFTSSNVWIDLFEGQQVATYSYYRYGTNKVLFGSDFKFHWESLLLHTFIDLEMEINGSFISNQRMLVTSKYYDSSLDAYIMEFHKKIQVPSTLFVNVSRFNFLSRNSLPQISADLQLLNNIQRGQITKSVQDQYTFNNLANELTQKFPTDSYFKVLVSDFRIRKSLSAIIYTDYKWELAMNILNLEVEKKYNFTNTVLINVPGFPNPKVRLEITGEHDLKVGDVINLEFNGGSGSSQFLNPQYFGQHTVVESFSGYNYGWIVTSLDYGATPLVYPDSGTISFIKRDSFLNYQPIDLIELGIDDKVRRGIEIKPEYVKLNIDKYNLVNVDLLKYRYRFVDGLSLEEVSNLFPWILEAEINNAVIGLDSDGLVWYSGDWLCGRWFGGTWYSGRWVSGDWYDGFWFSFNTIDNVISIKVDKSFSDPAVSKWFGGRWFDGDWYDGTWYNGRRYAGDWGNGLWYNGIWNDGYWFDGIFSGGVWVLGTWETGIFNSDAKPSYWIDGVFQSGDFENGIWYGGQFGNIDGNLSRFGIKASNSRNAIWHGGKWINGEFHSILNTENGNNLVSDIHKYSIWRTGIWLRGDFWGGVAYNIDFRSGVWHGGIL